MSEAWKLDFKMVHSHAVMEPVCHPSHSEADMSLASQASSGGGRPGMFLVEVEERVSFHGGKGEGNHLEDGDSCSRNPGLSITKPSSIMFLSICRMTPNDPARDVHYPFYRSGS